MLNVFSHPYQLDESISNFRVVGYQFFSFIQTSNETSACKHVLWRLIRVCDFCRGVTKKDKWLIRVKQASGLEGV